MIAHASNKPVTLDEFTRVIQMVGELRLAQVGALYEMLARNESFRRLTDVQCAEQLAESRATFHRKLPARKLTIIRDGGRTFYRSDEVLAIKSKGAKS